MTYGGETARILTFASSLCFISVWRWMACLNLILVSGSSLPSYFFHRVFLDVRMPPAFAATLLILDWLLRGVFYGVRF